MDLENIMLSEMSDGNRQELYDFSHMWTITQKTMNEQIKHTNKNQTHRCRQQNSAYQNGVG